jgi:hypothetical protein
VLRAKTQMPMLSVSRASWPMAFQSGSAARSCASLSSSTSHQRRPPSTSAGGNTPSGRPASAADRRGSPALAVSSTRERGVRTAMVRSRPLPVTRNGNRPAMPSCTSRPSTGAASPATSATCALPTLGCPANGTSRRGEKMRMR